jgi:hypothetical protein
MIYNRIVIPDYSVKRRTISEIAYKYNCNKVLIETGIYFGDTVEFLKNDFEQI